jgi:hypothetical protein
MLSYIAVLLAFAVIAIPVNDETQNFTTTNEIPRIDIHSSQFPTTRLTSYLSDKTNKNIHISATEGSATELVAHSLLGRLDTATHLSNQLISNHWGDFRDSRALTTDFVPYGDRSGKQSSSNRWVNDNDIIPVKPYRLHRWGDKKESLDSQPNRPEHLATDLLPDI